MWVAVLNGYELLPQFPHLGFSAGMARTNCSSDSPAAEAGNSLSKSARMRWLCLTTVTYLCTRNPRVVCQSHPQRDGLESATCQRHPNHGSVRVRIAQRRQLARLGRVIAC